MCHVSVKDRHTDGPDITFLPPASEVEVIESEPSVCACVCALKTKLFDITFVQKDLCMVERGRYVNAQTFSLYI